MRRSLAVVLVLLGVLTAPATVSASLQPYVFCPFVSIDPCWDPREVVFQPDGRITPRELPQREMAPVELEISGKISTADGTQPPALREAIFDFDKHGSIDATGLPACGRRQIEGRVTGPARAACRQAIVGGGVAQIQIGPPETEPTVDSTRLTLFNGGVTAGATKLLVHAAIAMPEPVSVIATVEIKRAQKGRYGWTSTTNIPRLFDGLGSLLSFELRIGRRFVHEGTQRSYLMARCFDGKLAAKMIKAVFRREAGNLSTTTLSGTVIRPCKQTGPNAGGG